MMPRWSVLRVGMKVVEFSMRSSLFVSSRSKVASCLVGGVGKMLSPSSWRLLMSSLLKSPPMKIVLFGCSFMMFVVEVTK